MVVVVCYDFCRIREQQKGIVTKLVGKLYPFPCWQVMLVQRYQGFRSLENPWFIMFVFNAREIYRERIFSLIVLPFTELFEITSTVISYATLGLRFHYKSRIYYFDYYSFFRSVFRSVLFPSFNSIIHQNWYILATGCSVKRDEIG